MEIYSPYIPPIHWNHLFQADCFHYKHNQKGIWMFRCIVYFPDEYSLFAVCPLCLSVHWSLFIYYMYLSLSVSPYSLFLNLIFKERLCQLWILWEIEPYFKILHLLACVNPLVTYVLQSLFQTVLCWMQF